MVSWHRNYHIQFSSASITFYSAGERQVHHILIQIEALWFSGFSTKIPNYKVDLFLKLGQINHKFQYSMTETGPESKSLAMWFHMRCEVSGLEGPLHYKKFRKSTRSFGVFCNNYWHIILYLLAKLLWRTRDEGRGTIDPPAAERRMSHTAGFGSSI